MFFINRDLYARIEALPEGAPQKLLEVAELFGEEEVLQQTLQHRRQSLGFRAIVFAFGVDTAYRLYTQHTYLFERYLSDAGYLLIKHANGPSNPKHWSVHLEASLLATLMTHVFKEWELDERSVTQGTISKELSKYSVTTEVRRQVSRLVYSHFLQAASPEGEIQITPRVFEVRGVDVPKELIGAQRLS